MWGDQPGVADSPSNQIGTPAVSFIALLDTGSSDLVVETAVQVDSCNGCATTGPLYDPTLSSSAVISNSAVAINYGIGNDTGVLVSDTVSFGGFSLPKTVRSSVVRRPLGLAGLTGQ